jgi:hypothetical protein
LIAAFDFAESPNTNPSKLGKLMSAETALLAGLEHAIAHLLVEGGSAETGRALHLHCSEFANSITRSS